MNPICMALNPMLRYAIVRLRKFLWLDSTAVELLIALISIGWGIQLARPEKLLEVASYRHMSLVASEEAWIVMMLVAGTAQLTAVIVCHRQARRFALMAMVALWWAVAALFWLSAPGTTAPTTYTVLAAACTWAFIRLGRPGRPEC